MDRPATANELRIIDTLYDRFTGNERVEKLRKYLAALSQRSRWGDIDSHAVLTHASQRLARARMEQKD
ncbi:hypothetical protein ACS7SF_17225 [Ralstonia sp. 25C]|uniref:hypothetical protein n=1 Tax=Ralstonia sp. 25C TaxID=3447363 RepID=UPI003F756D87